MAATAPCRHYDICHLPSNGREGEFTYCQLHLPQLQKNARAFEEHLQAYLGRGNCDLRHVFVPTGVYQKSPFEGHTFRSFFADFSHVQAERLNLGGARFEHGLRLHAAAMTTLDLRSAVVNGTAEIEPEQGPPEDPEEIVVT
jgi:hypothetical protein